MNQIWGILIFITIFWIVVEHHIISEKTELKWCFIKPLKYTKKSKIKIEGRTITVFRVNGDFYRPVFNNIPKIGIVDLIIVMMILL